MAPRSSSSPTPRVSKAQLRAPMDHGLASSQTLLPSIGVSMLQMVNRSLSKTVLVLSQMVKEYVNLNCTQPRTMLILLLQTMRNFVPFTTGETAYNNAMNSLGFRYAIWPSSSLIPLTSTTAAVFAPIVFTNSNNGAFNYAGTTLLSISVPQFSYGRSGPIAERANNLIFPDNFPEFGCVGGIRSCLLYTSPSPRDGLLSRMPSSA